MTFRNSWISWHFYPQNKNISDLLKFLRNQVKKYGLIYGCYLFKKVPLFPLSHPKRTKTNNLFYIDITIAITLQNTIIKCYNVVKLSKTDMVTRIQVISHQEVSMNSKSTLGMHITDTEINIVRNDLWNVFPTGCYPVKIYGIVKVHKLQIYNVDELA